MKVIGSISKKTKQPQVTRRLCAKTYDGRVTEARGRPLAIALCPGDLIALRPLGLGLKRTVYVSIAAVYDQAVWIDVKSKLMQKINAKKRR